MLITLAFALLGAAPAPIPPTPAVDDGPCPAGTFASLPEFDLGAVDYTGGAWTVDGVVVGHSAQEDECIIPVDTKVQWTSGVSHQEGSEGDTVAVVLYGSEDQCVAMGGAWWYEACELPQAELPVTR
jgi:hypothetical protein